MKRSTSSRALCSRTSLAFASISLCRLHQRAYCPSLCLLSIVTLLCAMQCCQGFLSWWWWQQLWGMRVVLHNPTGNSCCSISVQQAQALSTLLHCTGTTTCSALLQSTQHISLPKSKTFCTFNIYRGYLSLSNLEPSLLSSLTIFSLLSSCCLTSSAAFCNLSICMTQLQHATMHSNANDTSNCATQCSE